MVTLTTKPLTQVVRIVALVIEHLASIAKTMSLVTLKDFRVDEKYFTSLTTFYL